MFLYSDDYLYPINFTTEGLAKMLLFGAYLMGQGGDPRDIIAREVAKYQYKRRDKEKVS